MSLNIKNSDVEKLASQVALATGESKTEAIRKALIERRDRLGLKPTEEVLIRLAEELTDLHKGRKFEPVTKDEWDSIQT